MSAASLSIRGIDSTGVFGGRMYWAIKKPATMLPQASRLIGLIIAGSFSLMAVVGVNRG